MFSTEVILNALLYALGQATDSVKVCGTSEDVKLIYKAYCDLRNRWGVDDVMQQGLFQFDEATEAMLDTCAEQFK